MVIPPDGESDNMVEDRYPRTIRFLDEFWNGYSVGELAEELRKYVGPLDLKDFEYVGYNKNLKCHVFNRKITVDLTLPNILIQQCNPLNHWGSGDLESCEECNVVVR